jgi:hypothetical protein
MRPVKEVTAINSTRAPRIDLTFDFQDHNRLIHGG